jgi:hypothetical protein
MLRTLARLAVGLSLLCVAACGIESNDDLATKLKPLTPLQEGTYVGAEKNDKPFKVTRQGYAYIMEISDDATPRRARIHFYQFPEFDGYVLQLSVLDLLPGNKNKKHIYLFARVTQGRLVVYDEKIEHAVLPPHLANLFGYYNSATGVTSARDDNKAPAVTKDGGDAKNDDDNSAGSAKPSSDPMLSRTNRLRDGQSVLFVLKVLAVARYPLTELLSIKRIR